MQAGEAQQPGRKPSQLQEQTSKLLTAAGQHALVAPPGLAFAGAVVVREL